MHADHVEVLTETGTAHFERFLDKVSGLKDCKIEVYGAVMKHRKRFKEVKCKANDFELVKKVLFVRPSQSNS